jgi:hypothetical protein
MDTRLTVADCRNALYTEVDATDVNSSLFLPALNEVVERFINSGKWKGQTPFVTIPVNGLNYFSLPRWYVSVLVMSYLRCPVPVFTPFYQFSESGPGVLPDADAWSGVLLDLGDGFVTQYNITTAGTLRLAVSSASDAGKVIRLFGLDQNGADVYSADGSLGLNVTLANPTVTTTQQFSLVNGVQAPSTIVAPWTLSVINSGTPTLLSTYYPGETTPRYRRYQTGELEEAVQLICNRRYIPLRNETDWVIPGSLSALRYGLKMRAFENAGQIAEASAAFDRALDFLNQEAKASRGGGRITLNIDSTLMWGRTSQIGA